jgi:cytochrome c oxidase subunit 2
MTATVIVMRPDEYEQWLNRKPDGSRTREGEKVFLKYRCASCHTGDAGGRAPTLEDIYGRPIPLRDGRTVVADEEYIRESILDPGAKIVAGYENIMPTFRGQIDEDEIVQVIAWLRWLAKGQTPRRVEEFPPPTTTPPINPPEEKKL